MKFGLNSRVKQLNKKKKNKGIWRNILTVLSVIVVFCTTYALILPAITVDVSEKCGIEEHSHIESCYDAENLLICKKEIHAHTPQCYIDTAEENNPYSIDTLNNEATPDSIAPFALTRAALNSDTIVPDGVNNHFYSNVYMYYEMGPYTIRYNTNQTTSACSFVLVPTAENTYEWTPNPSTGWTSYIDSNYDVAYCADIRTYTHGTGDVYYNSTPLGNSYLGNDPEKERKLTAIIQHGYPFLSLDEVVANMKAANYTLSSGCGVAEFVAAMQWTIWEIANNADISGIAGSSKPGTDNVLSPITSYRQYDWYKDTINSDVNKIRQYLLSREADMRDELLIDDKSIANVQLQDNGTYTITVDISLSRALCSDESATLTLTDDTGNTNSIQVPENTNTFQVTLNNVKPNAGSISIDLNAKIADGYLGVFYYDSNQYQDMIGGKVINSYTDSALLNLGEKTTVTVNKQWDGVVGADEVKVNLYANGEKYGDAVTLNSKNNWSYTWKNLPTTTLEGNSVTYSVKEKLIPGYRPSIISTATSQRWKQVSAIEDGSTYMFVSSSGALASQNNSNGLIKWLSTNTSTVSESQQAAMWTVDIDESGSQATKFINNLSGKKLVLVGNNNRYYEIAENSTEYKGSITASKGKISTHNNGTTYYFSSISNGYGSSTTSGGTTFTFYKLINEGETTFTITNSKVNDVTSISTEKIWQDENGKNLQELPDNVTVKLLADGEEYDSVQLSQDNSWAYNWKGLPKYNENGNEIQYTVEEVPVEGYTTTIEKTEANTTVEKDVWKQTTALTNGKTYLFVNGTKALSKTNSNDEYLELATVDLTDAENTSSLSMWKATASGNSFTLQNMGKTNRYLAFYYIKYYASRFVAATSNASSYYYYKNLNYSNNNISYSNYKLTSVSDGYGNATTGTGTSYTLYELARENVTTKETKFVITNTKTPQTVGIKIKKTDYSDSNVFLEGATFDIYRKTDIATDGLIPSTEVYGIKVFENLTTTEAGEISVDGLSKNESYFIIETKAPDGYNKLRKPVEFKITATNISLVDTEMAVDVSGEEYILMIKNKEGYTLPQTGSIGTEWFTLGGLLMILSALFLLYIKRKKERCDSL